MVKHTCHTARDFVMKGASGIDCNDLAGNIALSIMSLKRGIDVIPRYQLYDEYNHSKCEQHEWYRSIAHAYRRNLRFNFIELRLNYVRCYRIIR
jgi:hypothetical protein